MGAMKEQETDNLAISTWFRCVAAKNWIFIFGLWCQRGI